MIHVRNNLLMAASLLLLFCLPAHAQQDVQFIPEIDAYLKLNSTVRLYLQAKDDREGGDSTQFAIGPSIQLYLEPLLKLKHVTVFDLDDSKSRAQVVEAGYRHITAPGAAPEERMLVAVTSNFPLKGDFLITDRNRADLDWKK